MTSKWSSLNVARSGGEYLALLTRVLWSLGLVIPSTSPLLYYRLLTSVCFGYVRAGTAVLVGTIANKLPNLLNKFH